MRKKVFGRKLSRGRKSREALLRSLVVALVKSGKISTTEAKAKAIQGQIDKLITLVKKTTIASRRRVVSYLGNDRKTVDFLVETIVPQFKQRTSGYTRMIKLPPRVGDMAKMARLQWTDEVVFPKLEEKVKIGKSKVKVGKEKVEIDSKKSKKTEPKNKK